MADNYAFTPGTGATGAADDIGGVLYPRVKITQGADGAATDVSSAAPLEVTVANTGSNATAIKVDGSAVTQPVSIAIAVPITDNSGSITVDNSGTFAVQATVAAGATNIAKAEDAASADADVGIPAMAVRKATPANTSGTDGDYEMLQMSAGRLWTDTSIGHLAGNTVSTGNGTSGTGVLRVAQVSDGTGVLAGVTTVTTLTGGGVAHDGVDSGNPVKTGGQARTTNPTAVADADRSNFITDKLGKQVVVGSIRDLKQNQVTTITSSVSETTIVTAGGASVFLDLYGLIITNTSATAVNVAIKDATAGTTRLNIAVPAGDTRGFMLPESGAIKQSSANGNWTATSSASVASLIITALTVANT